MLKKYRVRTNETYQEDFFKLPALNHFTKAEKIGSFRRTPCPEPSISKMPAKKKCLTNLE